MTVRLLDRAGAVLGWLNLPRTAKLADLEQLRNFGAYRLEVV